MEASVFDLNEAMAEETAVFCARGCTLLHIYVLVVTPISRISRVQGTCIYNESPLNSLFSAIFRSHIPFPAKYLAICIFHVRLNSATEQQQCLPGNIKFQWTNHKLEKRSSKLKNNRFNNIQATIPAFWLAENMLINPKSVISAISPLQKSEIEYKWWYWVQNSKIKMIDSSDKIELGQTKLQTKIRRGLKLSI